MLKFLFIYFLSLNNILYSSRFARQLGQRKDIPILKICIHSILLFLKVIYLDPEFCCLYIIFYEKKNGPTPAA